MTTSAQVLVSIVIPALNEAINLPILLKDVFSVIQTQSEYRFEVIVVDDHSSDDTSAVSQQAGARVIPNLRAGGKGNALITGFEQAKGDILIMMDADRSHRPEDIPSFLHEIKKGHGLVVGSRSTGGSDEYTMIRTLGNVGLSAVFRLMTGATTTDILNGYKAFRSEVFRRYRYRSTQFEIEIELAINTLRCGWTIGEFACHELTRAGGEAKSRVVKHGTLFLLKILQLGLIYRLERLIACCRTPRAPH